MPSGTATVSREQVVHLDDVDAAVAHLLDELEVVALGVLDPQHVVEEQRVAVRGREPLVGAARRAHHHLAELADLGVDAESGRCGCHWGNSVRLRVQIVM